MQPFLLPMTARNDLVLGGTQSTRVMTSERPTLLAGVEGGFYDGPGIVRARLLEVLPRKNSQLQVEGFSRFVLVLNSSIIVDSEDFTRAIAAFDFSHLSNIDRIYFELRSGGIKLVFDREVFDSLRREDLPPAYGRLLYQEILGPRASQRMLTHFTQCRNALMSSPHWVC